MKRDSEGVAAADRPRPRPLGWDFAELPTPEVEGPAVRSLPRNDHGRDLVVGDVHGQLEAFKRVLEEVGYSAEAGDRILLLGDVIDRGPDSAGMLRWLQRDGVTCVRGNHEQLMLDALDGNVAIGEAWMDRNGGEWARALGRAEIDAWHEVLKAMPLALEVEGALGTIVLAHAEIPYETPWWALKAWLEEGDRCASIRTLWARTRYKNSPEEDSGVPDVWRTFHGHVPVREPRRVANMRWIDLGAGWADWYDGAAVACVVIGQEGQECDPVMAKVIDASARRTSREDRSRGR